MAAKKKSRFTAEQVGAWHYVRAGTSSALDFGIGDKADCVNCGKPISHVFVTEVGPMGGDCLATITGDDSTRKVVQAMQRDKWIFHEVITGTLYRLTVSYSSFVRATCMSATYRDSGRERTLKCYSTPNAVLVAAAAQAILDNLAHQMDRTAPHVIVEEPH